MNKLKRQKRTSLKELYNNNKISENKPLKRLKHNICIIQYI